MKRLFQIGPQFLGNGKVKFAWQPSGNLVAAVGENQRNVFLFDRTGSEVIAEVALKSIGAPVTCMEWDPDGEVLAILQHGDPGVLLWNIATRKTEILEVSSRDPSFLVWSQSPGTTLAIGTNKGGLLLYNKRTMKKQTILGKHSKKISCGMWSSAQSASSPTSQGRGTKAGDENILALGSEDRNVTISREDGDSVEQMQLRAEPEQLQFCSPGTLGSPGGSMVEGGSSSSSSYVSFLQNKKSVVLLNWKTSSMQEQTFPDKYGQITSYVWAESTLLVGFASGHVMALQFSGGEKEELLNVKLHGQSVNQVAGSPDGLKIASSCGETGEIRFLDTRNWREQKSSRIQFSPEGRSTQLHWSQDGQLFTFATSNGYLYCYLARLTSLSSVCGDKVCYLTSLKEISVVSAKSVITQTSTDLQKEPYASITCAVEPSFLALGPRHVCAGMNNRVWFYSLPAGELCLEQEQMGTIEAVALSATHAATFIDGKISLNRLPGSPDDRERLGNSHNETQLFQKKSLAPLVAGEFLLYVSLPNIIVHYSLSDFSEVNEYRHSIAVKAIFPNQLGTRAAVLDTSGNLFVYSPVSDETVPVPQAPQHVKELLWDVVDTNAFVLSDSNNNLYAYYYMPNYMGGAIVRRLSEEYTFDMKSKSLESKGPDFEAMAVPTDNKLLLLYDGKAISQSAMGGLDSFNLRTHNSLVPYDTQGLEKAFFQCLGLNRLNTAYNYAAQMRQKRMWEVLGWFALECLDVEVAKKAYARLGTSPGMVFCLKELGEIESKQELSGHIYQVAGKFREAQESWLSCGGTYGLEALWMQLDLMNYAEAIPLAQAYAPYKLPVIYLRTARTMEHKGEFQTALQYYQQAVIRLEDAALAGGGLDKKVNAHNIEVQSGLARALIRTGDIPNGMRFAKEVNSLNLYKECAALLEAIKHNVEAGQMYEKAENYEKAAMLYIQDMNFDAATPLLSKIQTPKLFLQYGKAKESRGEYREALDAYERGKDHESVVRLLLNHLERPSEAFQLVRETRLTQGAELISEYCRRRGDIKSAIEFLLICNNREEAFHLASTHDEMDAFESSKVQFEDPEFYRKIAAYYETRSMLDKAALHFANCGDNETSVRLYLKSGSDADLLAAIDVVGKARVEKLTVALIDALMGDTNAINAGAVPAHRVTSTGSKDPSYVYKLHKALGNWEQAAKTALLIAKQEQDAGNYRVAHDLMYSTVRDLTSQNLPVGLELYRRLTLLHSYVIVKRIVKLGDHHNAATMLLRAGSNIEQFPEHVVPILTSVVIECQRAGLKQEAYTYAAMLMRPEYRTQISEQYKRKIETIVRKKQSADEGAPPPDAISAGNAPCPYCATMIARSSVDCSHC
ncbi:unnamed protein product, partial [Amoebophrya sp. A25]|eukprot:GSA25T00008411001.1